MQRSPRANSLLPHFHLKRTPGGERMRYKDQQKITKKCNIGTTTWETDREDGVRWRSVPKTTVEHSEINRDELESDSRPRK